MPIAVSTSDYKNLTHASKSAQGAITTRFDEIYNQQQAAQTKVEDPLKQYKLQSSQAIEKKKNGDQFDRDGLLKVMMAQMQNQGLEGTSTEAMMSNMSAIATVEQVSNTNQAAQRIDQRMAFMQAMELQDKRVTLLGSKDAQGYSQMTESTVKGVMPSLKGEPVLMFADNSKGTLERVLRVLPQNNIAEEEDLQKQEAQAAILKYLDPLNIAEDKTTTYKFAGRDSVISKADMERNVAQWTKQIVDVTQKDSDIPLYRLSDGRTVTAAEMFFSSK